MFERIVAAVDRDEQRARQVVQTAVELGKSFRSDVLVVHVREVERSGAAIAAMGKPGALPPLVHIDTDDSAEALVNGAVEELKKADVSARGEVRSAAGSTARELLDIAAEYGADLIVVGDRDSRVTDVLLGGVAHRISHLAPCPVLLVR